MKIFLSAVTAQFKACRDALASDLRKIGCTVSVQEAPANPPRGVSVSLDTGRGARMNVVEAPDSGG